jgi:pimeloyl-ACP methyl ester carboxylesterase
VRVLYCDIATVPYSFASIKYFQEVVIKFQRKYLPLPLGWYIQEIPKTITDLFELQQVSGAESITLPDGRTLAYGIYGDKNGAPLVFHHGMPGSRVLATLLSEAACKQDVCVIAPTRPGYGASDPDPNRTLDTWANDCVALADHLSLGSFAVVGFSGGSPFALRVAESVPNRVTDVGLIGGLVPGSDGNLFETLARMPRLLGLTFRMSEWLARYRGPEFVVEQLTDEAVADETANTVYQDFRTALEHGPAGTVRESRLFADDWTLPVPDTPVCVWHGVNDENVSIGPVRDEYDDLPDVSLSEIETDHLGTLLSTRESVVRLSK